MAGTFIVDGVEYPACVTCGSDCGAHRPYTVLKSGCVMCDACVHRKQQKDRYRALRMRDDETRKEHLDRIGDLWD